MKINFLLITLIVLLLTTAKLPGLTVPLSGSVEEEHYIQFDKTNTVVDASTGQPISNAIVSIPSHGITVQTNQKGEFNLNTSINKQAILSINAKGYKPFSLTINEKETLKPLTLGITKETGRETVIDSNLHHLGDDTFSKDSANAAEFRLKSTGPFFHKEFYIDKLEKNSNVVLKIGSLIGVDTEIARRLNQGNTLNGISSPTKIYLNSHKIGELKINGDNQEIPVPVQLLNQDSFNQIVIETGQNLYSKKKVDHDDIEFINLVLEFK
jgi:hypothetical protein